MGRIPVERRRAWGWIGVTIAALVGGLGGPQAAERPAPPPTLPLGVSRVMYELSVPPEAAPTAAKIALGERLFNDKRLSVDDSVSCSTCHDPKRGFVDHKPQSEGVK